MASSVGLSVAAETACEEDPANATIAMSASFFITIAVKALKRDSVKTRFAVSATRKAVVGRQCDLGDSSRRCELAGWLRCLIGTAMAG